MSVPRTLTSVAVTAALAAAATVAAASPAAAEPTSLSNVVSTAAGNGLARVDATCHFGPVVPDNFEDQMVVTGVATAPGADSTTVRCWWTNYFGNESGHDAVTTDGPVSVSHDTSPHWRSAWRICVSASADFSTTLGVVVTAPAVCV